MPPVFQVDPNSDRITTVGAVGLCSSRLVLVQKHCLPALNTPVQVAIPAHVHINASILARILSLCSRFIVAHGVNYETTSTNVIPISNRACMSIAVVTSVVLLCLPVGLFLALFMRRRSTGNRGRSNNGLRRTYSPVYPVLSSRRWFFFSNSLFHSPLAKLSNHGFQELRNLRLFLLVLSTFLRPIPSLPFFKKSLR